MPMFERFSLTLPGPAEVRDRTARAVVFLVWIAAVLYMVATHVFWRDEVRAFTLALSGDGVIGLLRAIHGEGHPALWYLLLRAVHTVIPVREVLPALAAAIGIAAAAMLAFRSPFHLSVIALILFGEWMLFEYVVVARNYGISVLLLFLLADRHARAGGRGLGQGALLFLLCNTNAPSILLAGGFLLFWLTEIVTHDGLHATPALRRWAVAAACAAAGVVACVLVIYPPYNDAAVSPMLARLTPGMALAAAFQVSQAMGALLPGIGWEWPWATVLLTLLVVATPLSLARTPGGLVAAAVVTVAMILFFRIVYTGYYRHAALLLAFVVSLHWAVARGGGGRWPVRIRPFAGGVATVGGIGFALLLAVQVAAGIAQLAYLAHGGVFGRAADLGRLLHRPDLRNAVVIANPDVMVEALPYYAPNLTYLVREGRFGRVVRFTFHPRRDLSLADMLATARALHRRTRYPVVIALRERLEEDRPTRIRDEGYGITFSTTPAQVHAFRAATRPLARFAPSQVEENYDVYLLTG